MNTCFYNVPCKSIPGGIQESAKTNREEYHQFNLLQLGGVPIGSPTEQLVLHTAVIWK